MPRCHAVLESETAPPDRAVWLQSTTGLYVFWAVYAVVVLALGFNYLRNENKEWL